MRLARGVGVLSKLPSFGSIQGLISWIRSLTSGLSVAFRVDGALLNVPQRTVGMFQGSVFPRPPFIVVSKPLLTLPVFGHDKILHPFFCIAPHLLHHQLTSPTNENLFQVATHSIWPAYVFYRAAEVCRTSKRRQQQLIDVSIHTF